MNIDTLVPASEPCGAERQQRAPQKRPKQKRSRHGCKTCRARKVKCDERPNGCANCEKLHLECSGYGRSPTLRATGNRRTYRSCDDCRLARCKCSGDRPVCTRCREKNLRCSFQATVGQALMRASQGAGTGPDSVPPLPGQTADTPLPWLNSLELPGSKHVRVLVNYYFQNFHPLRCFGFIHKPSFLRKLDEKPATSVHENSLLHIMCTIGAQFYALEYSDTIQELPATYILHAGSRWAQTTRQLLMGNTDKITIDGLMTAQLLYDYDLRMANFAQAFILSALMARMTQALQINLEYSEDILAQPTDTSLSVSTRECRRRLMWSCYVTDTLLNNSVDQLTLIHEQDLKIQLPSNEWSFLRGHPCVTRTLTGNPLPFVRAELIPADVDGNMGLLAAFVQLMEMRRRALRYIKHLDEAKLPWLPDSEFTLLDAELRGWHESLPENLTFSTSTIYMRQESSQLGALCVFHCAYHQTMCDLYRIGTPALYQLRSAFAFPPEKTDYQKNLQWALFKEARTIAAIIAEGLRHGPRVIGDTWFPTITYDSNRIMLFYLTQNADMSASRKRELVLQTIPYLQSNLKALKAISAINVVADGLFRAAETMLEKLGIKSNNILPLPNVILDDPYLALLDRSRHGAPETSPESAPDYILNPLSIFRMARSHISEGNAIESTSRCPRPGPAQQHTRTVLSEATPAVERFISNPNVVSDDTHNPYESFGLDLDMFFASDAGLDWQSAETVVSSGVEGDGLMPWMGMSHLGDFDFDQPHT